MIVGSYYDVIRGTVICFFYIKKDFLLQTLSDQSSNTQSHIWPGFTECRYKHDLSLLFIEYDARLVSGGGVYRLVFIIAPLNDGLQHRSSGESTSHPVDLQRGKVVDSRKLDQGRGHEGEADGNEPVHGCSVGHFGQWRACADAQCGHGEDGGDSCRSKWMRKAVSDEHVTKLWRYVHMYLHNLVICYLLC